MTKAVVLFVHIVLVSWIKAEIIQSREYGVYKRYRPLDVNCDCNLLLTALKNIDAKLSKCLENKPGENCNCINVPRNCEEVLKCGCKSNGVYTVNPDGKDAFKVYCDQKTNGGGWTVIQRRKDGSVDFYRGWHDYKVGLGNLKGEFWLGLDKIHRLTHQTRNRLRVELEDTAGNMSYAGYDNFAVSDENNFYKLVTVGAYSGTAGDSLSNQLGAAFTTKDRDHDSSNKNCAVTYKGAWWYVSCHRSNLNGKYYNGAHKSYADGINWYSWKGHHYSAARAEMKIKPK